MEESWEEKTERLEREYQARIDRLREELDCGQDGPCVKAPGCNRHWEERNRELVQRVAELEQKSYDLEMALGPYSVGAIRSDLADELCDIARSQDNEHWDEVLRGAAARIEYLQSQLEAKGKRVAELEDSLSKERDAAIGLRNRVSELEDEAVLDVQLIDDQRATIAALESQLKAKDKRVAELEEIATGRAQLIDDQRETIESLQSQLEWTLVSAGLPTEPGYYQFIGPDRTTTIWELGAELWVECTQPEDPWSLRQMKGHVDTFCTHYRRIELPKGGES